MAPNIQIPQAHQTNASPSHTPSKCNHCKQSRQPINTINNIPAIESYDKHRQTIRALTSAAETITTPELSPCTAKGVILVVVVPSPSCALQISSHVYHFAKNKCRTSPHPLNKCSHKPSHIHCIPSTTSLQMTPQSHTCGSEYAHVSCPEVHRIIHMRIPARNATISTTHIVRANVRLQTFKYHKHTKQTHHHHRLLSNATTANKADNRSTQ